MSSPPAPAATRLPSSECPGCGYIMNAASSVDRPALPKEGDVSVCLSCTIALVFGADLRLRAMTMEEALELPPGVAALLIRSQQGIARLNAAGLGVASRRAARSN